MYSADGRLESQPESGKGNSRRASTVPAAEAFCLRRGRQWGGERSVAYQMGRLSLAWRTGQSRCSGITPHLACPAGTKTQVELIVVSVGRRACVYLNIKPRGAFRGCEFHLMNCCGIDTTGNVSLNGNAAIIPQNRQCCFPVAHQEKVFSVVQRHYSIPSHHLMPPAGKKSKIARSGFLISVCGAADSSGKGWDPACLGMFFCAFSSAIVQCCCFS